MKNKQFIVPDFVLLSLMEKKIKYMKGKTRISMGVTYMDEQGSLRGKALTRQDSGELIVPV
ncbi:hypothetical protein [Yersinia kristensenii]|uniref:hypothetical protein n=1 Tax=Yersinia kristensenii TaxID=28152 RepID=UPI00067B1CB9|nr:hypothetical protein [Yersinia kristensenii]